MKNKKSLLSLGLLALVLVLGVGYALVSSQDLSISGSASTSSEEMNVHFTETVTNGTVSEGVTATGSKLTDLTASIAITGLDAINDSAEVVYEIANDETDLNAEVILDAAEGKTGITVLSDENVDLSSFYEVTVTTLPLTIEASSTDIVTVKVTLKKLPITEDESKANIVIDLLANPVQP